MWEKYTHLHETLSIYRVNNNNFKRFFFTQEEVIAEHTWGTYITVFYWDPKANRKDKGCNSYFWKANEFSFWLFYGKVQQSVMKLEGIARVVSGI